MRIEVIIGFRHGITRPEIVSGPDVSVTDQRERFKSDYQLAQSHPHFAEVRLCELTTVKHKRLKPSGATKTDDPQTTPPKRGRPSMKHALSLIGAAFTMFTLSAFAQVDINTTSLNGGTNNIASTTTRNFTIPLSITRGSQMAIQLSCKALGATTSNVTVNMDESVDNVIWEASKRSFVLALNGTSVVNVVTNYNFGAVPFVRISSIQNGAGEAITNIVVKYSVKPGL
jgi:hypothetical protein